MKNIKKAAFFSDINRSIEISDSSYRNNLAQFSENAIELKESYLFDVIRLDRLSKVGTASSKKYRILENDKEPCSKEGLYYLPSEEANAAAWKIAELNIGLAFASIKALGVKGVQRSDLLQELYFSIRKAALKYNSDKGVSFSTYAYWWIRSSLTQFLFEEKKLVQPMINRVSLENFKRIEKIKAQLSILNQPADLFVLKEKTGLNRAEIEKTLLLNSSRMVSLDQPIDYQNNDSSNLQNFISSEGSSKQLDVKLKNEENYLLRELVATLDKILKGKNKKRDIEIILVRFGFKNNVFGHELEVEDGESPSLRCIADALQMSKERIRQIEERVLRLIREDKDFMRFLSDQYYI